MKVTYNSVFHSLAPGSRRAFLALHDVDFDDEEDQRFELSAARIPKLKFAKISLDLEKIAILGSQSADPLLHQALIATGWTAEQFKATCDGRERALALLQANRSAFEDVTRVWNANRLYWRQVQESSFRLPEDLPTMEKLDWKLGPVETGHPLDEVVRSVMSDHFAGKPVIRAHLLRRSNSGLDSDSQTLLQLDISYGEDKQLIDVNEEGEEARIEVSFLSMIVVLIDLEGHSIQIGSTVGKKSYRSDLANSISKVLHGSDASLANLDPIRVYPEKLKTQPRFERSASDGISEIQVSELSYHEAGDPWAIGRKVYTTSRGHSLYDRPDFARAPYRKHVFGAVIDFYFGDQGSSVASVKRSVRLSGRTTISYGKAFPHQRVAIRRVLQRAELIEKQFDWSDDPDFRRLQDLLSSQHELGIRSTWPAELIVALTGAGILVQGEPATEVWCDVCQSTHETGDPVGDSAEIRVAKCPFEAFPVTDEMLDTLVLDIAGLMKWLKDVLGADQPIPTNLDGAAWFLGEARLKASSAPVGVYFAPDPISPDSLQKLTEHIAILPLKRGFVLSLSPQEIPSTILNGWKAIPLHLALSHKDGRLRLERGKLGTLFTGKPAEKAKSKKEGWNAFFERFKSTNTGCGHYAEARRMRRDHPEVCPADVPQLARRLKSEFPDRFSADKHQ